MGPLILVVLALVIVGFLVFAYSRGGEMPTQRVEKQIPLPTNATQGSNAAPETSVSGSPGSGSPGSESQSPEG